ncbi:zinc finger and SCAN domain-containing protein 2-like [Mercenaria mercenaria]|uniref:zinc finger and SCAN domain-containing protein 2-like n=1 Tax=Mercenaria mercenaria TaxID=6596 RepID=UPI00234E8D38|nr:zinc finger and SCAN domain-containing protein 2-like [Mercenaria mercenaria]XP_045214550.2 zinc finger and SCAN domain-containing protein 2-like [Mercenaria mercenaria]
MEDIHKPFILYLTSRQEQELWQYFRQSCWQIGIFKCVHQDLQFLVDLMIHDEKLALDTLKKCKLHSKGKRQARKRQYVNNGTKFGGKKFCRKNKNQHADTSEYRDLTASENGNNSNCSLDQLEQNSVSKTMIGTVVQSSSEKIEDIIDEDSSIRNTKVNTVETLHKENMQDKQPRENLQKESLEGNINGKIEQSVDSDICIKTNERTNRRLRSANSITQSKNLDRYKLKQLANMAERRTNFSCRICGKVAASEQHLKRHTARIHSEEALKKKKEEKKRKQQLEVIACHICRKQFADKHALNTHHLNMHSELKSGYQCDLCGAVLKHMGNLVQHKKSLHSDTRPHRCDVCGSTFKLHQHLKTHMRRHDPDYVETCTVCGKTLRKGHLSTHMKRHTSEKKFNCDKCGKKFYEKQDLKRHVILHSGEKPNKCPYCPYACALKGNLTKHINIRHENEMCISDLQRANSKNTASISLEEGNKGKQSKSDPVKVNSILSSNIKTPNIITPSSSVSYVNVGHLENDKNCYGNKLNSETMNSISNSKYFGDNLRKNITSSAVTLIDVDSRGEQFTSDTQLENLI